jgi:Asp-tRNA(Asn)/Glu-tRNA(Gln) amidotransferase A subunit family amidase
MTMPGDLLSGALTEIARDLREKPVTARELIEAAVARHERFGERLHAYSLWAPEQARAVAAAADAAFSAGVTVGPLQGLPVSIKDLFAAPGTPASPGRAVGCRRILGSGTDRWWRRCAASSASSRAKSI